MNVAPGEYVFDPLDQPVKLLFAFVTPAAIACDAPKLYEVGDGILPLPPLSRYVIVYDATFHVAVSVRFVAPIVTVPPAGYVVDPSLQPANV